MAGFYEVFEGGDDNWPEWAFATPTGLQVTVTSVTPGTEDDAKAMAETLALDAKSAIRPGAFVTSIEDGSPAMVFAVWPNALRLLNEDGEFLDVPRDEWEPSPTVWWGENDYVLSSIRS